MCALSSWNEQFVRSQSSINQFGEWTKLVAATRPFLQHTKSTITTFCRVTSIKLDSAAQSWPNRPTSLNQQRTNCESLHSTLLQSIPLVLHFFLRNQNHRDWCRKTTNSCTTSTTCQLRRKSFTTRLNLSFSDSNFQHLFIIANSTAHVFLAPFGVNFGKLFNSKLFVATCHF